jgi:hypothetical protein
MILVGLLALPHHRSADPIGAVRPRSGLRLS